MIDSDNGKELTEQPAAEQFHTAARLRELEAGARTPWVKKYLRSLIQECERMAGEHEASDPAYARAVLEYAAGDLGN
jgi:hypothetical protein